MYAAGTAGEAIDLHHPVFIAIGIEAECRDGSAEDRHHRRAYRHCQVHGGAVIADQQAAAADQQGRLARGQLPGGRKRPAFSLLLNFRDDGIIGWAADQHYPVAVGQPVGQPGKFLRNPALGGPYRSRGHGNQRLVFPDRVGAAPFGKR